MSQIAMSQVAMSHDFSALSVISLHTSIRQCVLFDKIFNGEIRCVTLSGKYRNTSLILLPDHARNMGSVPLFPIPIPDYKELNILTCIFKRSKTFERYHPSLDFH